MGEPSRMTTADDRADGESSNDDSEDDDDVLIDRGRLPVVARSAPVQGGPSIRTKAIQTPKRIVKSKSKSKSKRSSVAKRRSNRPSR